MNKLNELIKYILIKYPKIEELSKPRLVKLIYLIDWKHSIEYGVQYTDIRWIYNHYGPYVNDVINTIKNNPDIYDVYTRENPYGGITDKFKIKKSKNLHINIDMNGKKIADFIIEKTFHIDWSNFISIVYSTYPIRTNLKYSTLDLKLLAEEYKQEKTTGNTVYKK